MPYGTVFSRINVSRAGLSAPCRTLDCVVLNNRYCVRWIGKRNGLGRADLMIEENHVCGNRYVCGNSHYDYEFEDEILQSLSGIRLILNRCNPQCPALTGEVDSKL